MLKLHGKDGRVVLGGTTVTTASTWELTANRDYADISTFGDLGQVVVPGLPAVTGSFNGLYDADGDVIVATGVSSALITIALYASTGKLVGTGSGYVLAGIDSSVTDAVRVHGTFRSSGVWTIA